MAIKFNRSQTFATNGTVTASGLHNLVDSLDIYQSLITDQTNVTSVSTADELLIAIAAGSSGDAPKAVTVQELFQDALSAGTYTNANISETLSYGTATGNRTVSTSATITTGTITNLTSSTANITLGTIPTLTAGTTTSTAATITSGTITNLASTTGTIATLNSTTGTIATLNSTTGTIATLNSTTGTITNLSTTLAGDFTISQGTGTLGTSGVTLGTYGGATAIPFLTVNAKGIITAATTGTFSTVPADGSITPAKLSQPFTSVAAVAATSGTAIDFTSIPSWVKRVTVNLLGVSTDGVSPLRFRIGPVAGVETSGYLGSCLGFATTTVASIACTAGFDLNDSATAAAVRHGSFILILADSATNTWTFQGTQGQSNTTAGSIIGAQKPLAGVLSVLRITTVSGTGVFDAGSVSILYEG